MLCSLIDVLVRCTHKSVVEQIGPKRADGSLRSGVDGSQWFNIPFHLATGLQMVRCRCEVLRTKVLTECLKNVTHELRVFIS